MGTSILNACAAIHTPGAYNVVGDLSGSDRCLSVSNVANVQIDCAGHSVSGLSIAQASGVTVTNCSVPTEVTLTGVYSISLRQSTLTGGLGIADAAVVEISDSKLTAALDKVVIATGSGITLLRDTISNTGRGTTAAIYLHDGSNNQILQTIVSGTGGTDDGIILSNETADTIRGDTISGFFDAGIETLDSLHNTMIADNGVSAIGLAAFAGYWCTNWTNNTIQSNHVSATATLAWILYQTGPDCGTSPSEAAFTNNQFIGNVFRDQVGSIHASGTPGAVMDVRMSGPVSGNLLQGNDFGPYSGPYLKPLDGFIDGGGNICGPMNPLVSNFTCSGSGSSIRDLALLDRPSSSPVRAESSRSRIATRVARVLIRMVGTEHSPSARPTVLVSTSSAPKDGSSS